MVKDIVVEVNARIQILVPQVFGLPRGKTLALF